MSIAVAIEQPKWAVAMVSGCADDVLDTIDCYDTQAEAFLALGRKRQFFPDEHFAVYELTVDFNTGKFCWVPVPA